ncbi:MAG: TIGR03668 family PPOX class F420-dependent oxidoreductase [Actinobacteria bacterium]|nr:TIGR03668 family PPOX class F420-dependent oxidoreductase [Actinomycetota bacterium]
MSPEEARRLLETARVAQLGTVRPDGSPHLVPVTFALEADLIFSAVDAKPKRTKALARLYNIIYEPRVSLIANNWDEDWDRLWWVRADGIARIQDSDEHAIALLMQRYAQYREPALLAPVIIIEVTRWSGWKAR